MEGYQPSELNLRLLDLWDEFGVDYKGVLTYETEGAPIIFHMYHTRETSGHIEKLSPEGCMHKAQVDGQFQSEVKTSRCNVKGVDGGTGWTIEEILQRRDCKKRGLQMPVKRAVAPAFTKNRFLPPIFFLYTTSVLLSKYEMATEKL